jgi:hypothetical protein
VRAVGGPAPPFAWQRSSRPTPTRPRLGRPRRERESVALPLVAQPHRWRGRGDVIGFIVRTGLPDLRTVRTEASGRPAVAWYVRGTPAPKFSL